MRVPLAATLESRDGTVDQDAKVLNGIVETRGEASAVRKRPGLSDIGLMRAGVAQALTYWNSQAVGIVDDYLTVGVAAEYTTSTIWNSADKTADVTLSGSDLVAQTNTAGSAGGVRSVASVSSGLWYFEATVNDFDDVYFGLANSSKVLTASPAAAGSDALTYHRSGAIQFGNTSVASATSFGNGVVIALLLDVDARTVKFYRANVLQATVTSAQIPTGALFAYFGSAAGNGTSQITANFGAVAFTYTVPGLSSTSITPTTADLQFSMQDNGSNAPGGSLLMFKNREQAWYANTTPTVTQVTDVDYPGKYAVTLQSLTRSSTTATATTTGDTNFQVGGSVVLAGVNEAGWNGTYTITGITASVSNPEKSFRVTITRSGTTATATSINKPHGLLTGASVVISGASAEAWNGTYTITVTSATTFTYTVTVTAGTVTGAGTDVKLKSLTRLGTTAIAEVDGVNPFTAWGQSVTIAGATESAYNGTYTTFGNSTIGFQYTITVTGGGGTTTGSASGLSLTLSRTAGSSIVTATASGAHGLLDGSTAIVSGASPSSYNGSWKIAVVSTTVFTYDLAQVGTASLQRAIPSANPPDGKLYACREADNTATTVVFDTAINGPDVAIVTTSGAPPAWVTSGAIVGMTIFGYFKFGPVISVSGSGFVANLKGSGTASGFTGSFSSVQFGRAFSLSSVSNSTSTASVTTSAAHGWSSSNTVRVFEYPQNDKAWSWSVYNYPYNECPYAAFCGYLFGLTTITVTGASTFTYVISTYRAESPSTTITGTITGSSSGITTYSDGTPGSPATGTILATSSGSTANDTPISPAGGTITAKVLASITPPTFTFTVDGTETTPATGTITATSGRNTVPGIAYMDGYFVVMDVNGVVYNSAPDNPGSWNALEYITAQAETGAGKFLGRSQSYIVALKEWSTEFFYNAGNPIGSPFSPVPNAFTQVGCASGESVATIDKALIWISQSRKKKGRSVHMMDGMQQAPISTEDVERVLNADDLAEVYAYGVTLDGHPLYILTLVTSNITLVYDLKSQTWGQWTSLTLGSQVSVSTITRSGTTATVTTGSAHDFSDGDPVKVSGASQSDYNGTFQISYISTTSFSIEVSNSPATPATGTILAYPYTETYWKFTHYATGAGRDFLLHKSDGHLYEFSSALYQDNAIPVNFFMRTARLDGAETRLKKMPRITLIGDKQSDTAMIRWSDDDSATFSAYRRVDLSDAEPMLRRCGSFRRRSLEVRHTGNTAERFGSLELEVSQ